MVMSRTVQFLLLILFIQSTTGTLGVDLSQLYGSNVYQCLKQNNYNFVVIRGYCSYGGVDPNILNNLNNARGSGLDIDVYLFPCRGKSATAQINEFMNTVPSNLYGTLWIDIQTNPSPGCGWATFDDVSNCNFINQLIAAAKSRGKNPGIYASTYMWQTILGNPNNCKQPGTQSLWYAHYDNNPSFSDFTSFGGWTQPSIKQYQGTHTVCGAGVDANFKP